MKALQERVKTLEGENQQLKGKLAEKDQNANAAKQIKILST